MSQLVCSPSLGSSSQRRTWHQTVLLPVRVLARTAAGADARSSGGFEAAVVRAQAALEPQARRWSSDAEAASDLLQRTVERALARGRLFRPGTNVSAWMRKIMYHLAVDESRRAQRERHLRAHYSLLAPAHFDPSDLENGPGDGQGESRREPTAGDVHRAAAGLDEPFRSIFFLRVNDRLSYQAISQRLGIPVGTVGTRLLRARRAIEKALVQHGGTGAVSGSGWSRRCGSDRPW